MPTQTLIHSARVVSSGRVLDNGWVLFDDDRIAAVGQGDTFPSDDRPHRRRRGGPLAHPGFIDIHGHGGGGAAFDDGADAIRTALAVHRRHGTTRSVLSLVTAAVADLERELAAIADAVRGDPLILGSHLEGPFLDDGHRGAHDPSLLRTADPDSIERMLSAAAGTLVQVTLAPELPGGMDALRQFVDASVAVAVGHCGAGLRRDEGGVRRRRQHPDARVQRDAGHPPPCPGAGGGGHGHARGHAGGHQRRGARASVRRAAAFEGAADGSR